VLGKGRHFNAAKDTYTLKVVYSDVPSGTVPMADVTKPPADFFLDSLYGVVGKTSAFLKIHAPRYQKIWAEFYAQWDPNPQSICIVTVNKLRFYQDLTYRVEVLRVIEKAMVEGLQAIKRVLITTFGRMLPDEAGLGKIFAPADVKLIGYRVAEKLIGVLQRMISLASCDVPIQYILVAKTKAMLKLSPMTDEEILKGMTSANIPCTLEAVRNTFARLERGGLVQVDRKNPKQEIYANLKEFKLSAQSEATFTQKFLPVLDWCIQLWQSFYNVRELDVKIPDHIQWKSHVEQITAKAATQGFTNAHYVIKHLADYFEAVQKKEANPPSL